MRLNLVRDSGYSEVCRQKFVNYLNQKRAQGRLNQPTSTERSISPYCLFRCCRSEILQHK
jgi:hypothetical protein